MMHLDKKSLLTLPAYRQAGFAKGRRNHSPFSKGDERRLKFSSKQII